MTRLRETNLRLLSGLAAGLALLVTPFAAWAQAEPPVSLLAADIRAGEGLPRELTGLAPSFPMPVPGPTASELPGAATPTRLAPVLGRNSPAWPTLQIAFGTVQVLDTISTLRGVRAGLQEANPVLRGLTDHPAAFVAAKTGAAAATLWLTRRMARKHRMAAMITMAAVNSGYAMVVARNFRMAAQVSRAH